MMMMRIKRRIGCRMSVYPSVRPFDRVNDNLSTRVPAHFLLAFLETI